jgi:hypothetical protein
MCKKAGACCAYFLQIYSSLRISLFPSTLPLGMLVKPISSLFYCVSHNKIWNTFKIGIHEHSPFCCHFNTSSKYFFIQGTFRSCWDLISSYTVIIVFKLHQISSALPLMTGDMIRLFHEIVYLQNCSVIVLYFSLWPLSYRSHIANKLQFTAQVLLRTLGMHISLQHCSSKYLLLLTFKGIVSKLTIK